VLGSARTEQVTMRFRRGIGWFVVILSFAVVLRAVVEKLAG
jgi:hypothetical protein